jgi:hypothetical protein
VIASDKMNLSISSKSKKADLIKDIENCIKETNKRKKIYKSPARIKNSGKKSSSASKN